MFTPVPISEENSPLQVYEMYNGGALSVKYELNTVPLKIMRNVSCNDNSTSYYKIFGLIRVKISRPGALGQSPQGLN